MRLNSIGEEIARRRKQLKLSQVELARKAGISRATLDALENGRVRELGFTKLSKLVSVLGLELNLRVATSQRPTLEELLEEDRAERGSD